MIAARSLERRDFRSDGDWQRVVVAYGQDAGAIPLAPRWVFPNLKIVPQESRMDLLRLSIGSHDAATQMFANSLGQGTSEATIDLRRGVGVIPDVRRVSRRYRRCHGRCPWASTTEVAR